MKSQIISKDKGFTFIEILITIAILCILFTVGSFMHFSSYRGNLLNTEETTLISILQKARNRAMNNIDQTPHGVHIDTSSYVLFEGTSYSPISSSNEIIPKNSNTTIVATIHDIVFEQLSGNPLIATDIVLQNEVSQRTISIKTNGVIDW